jgi:hypothetical protein
VSHQRTNPYTLQHRAYQVGEIRTHVIFGKAAQKPFGMVSDDIKREMGRRLVDLAKKEEL